VKLLLAAGASVEAKDEQGATPLNLAANQGIAEVLLGLRGKEGNGSRLFLVAIERTRDSFDELLRSSLLSAWNAESGFSLIFVSDGAPATEVSPGNKSMVIQLTIEEFEYSDQGWRRAGENEKAKYHPVPQSATIRFKTIGAEGVSTSWDNLPPMTVKSTLPEMMLGTMREPHLASTYAEVFMELSLSQYGSLCSALGDRLKEIPRFRVLDR
jgi:hypothetical protein